MRKIYFLLLSFLVLTRYAAQSQCTFASSFGSATIDPAGAIVTISGCSFAGEYSTISGAVNGQTLKFTTSVPTDFITIHSGTFNGPVVASGITPLIFANTFTGTLYAHWAADASCNTQASCRTTTVQCTSCVLPPPANDLCSGAININCGQTIAATTSGATVDAVPTCVYTLNTAPGVWYKFVGDGSMSTLSLCGSGFDTKIGVFTGTCGALVCVTGNDDFCGLQSQVTFTTTIGTTYYVLVTGFGSASGSFSLTLTCGPPPNDLCTGAININCGQTITGNTGTGATIDPVPTCVTALNTAPGLWYSFLGDGSITTLSLCGSSYDTKIGVFTGTCGALVCVTGNDDFCGLQSQVTFATTVGTTYYILVTGFGSAVGAFTLARTCVFPCTGVPSPGLITGPSGTLCNPTPVTLTVSGYSSGAGISFQWNSSSTSGGPYTPIAGATNNTYSFSATSTMYYTVTVTCSYSGLSANTTQFAVNISTLALINVLATPSTTCAPAPTVVITGTATGGTVGGTTVLASSGTINLAIPDLTTVSSSLVVPASTIPNFNSLKIRLNIGHSWVGDLKITLTTPCGNTIIFDRPGVPASGAGNSDNLGTTNAGSPPAPPSGVYIFDVAGATIIPEVANGTTGFIAPGTYQPSESSNPGVAHNWAGLTFPCSTAGTWTLTITDNAGGDIGNLTDWAILVPSVYTHILTGPGVITQNPPTGINNANASFNVTGAPVGVDNYTLTTTDGAGCTTSATVSVTVNATPVVTFVPAAPVICAGAIQQLTPTVVPGNVQTFTSGTINLAIPDATPAGVNTPPIVLPAGTSIINPGDLKVRINATHTWVGDLIFRLTSPCGVTYLFDRPGVPASTFGNSDNLGTTNAASNPPPAVYTFDLAGATVIPEVAGGTGFIAAGSYKPSDVNGVANNWAGLTFPCSGAGNWTLNVSDNGGGDVGTLVDWAILYNIPVPVVFSPIANLFTDALATVAYTGTPVTTIWAKPPTTTTYTATATVNGCTGSGNVTVTVNQLPAITVQPAPATQTICPGFTVTYTVTATGAGLTYQWRQNGVNLVNNVQTSGVNTNTLVITNVSVANAGNYDVVVSGTCPPSVTSTPVTLNIGTAPTITTQPVPVIVCAGANAVFSVVATGVPPPTIYQWQVSTDGGVTWTNLLTGGSFTPTFTITGTTTSQNNNRYRVIVTNSCGQSITSASALLTVNAIPVVTVTPLTSRICLTDTLVPLIGSPVGGNWSGIGVSGFNFVPSATAVGIYTLTYTYTNAAGCTATGTVTAKVEDCPERIRLLRDNAIILYPNPNDGHFNIRINSTLYNYIGMRVFTSSGDLVKTVSFNGLIYGRVVPIDISQFPAGVYMVKFYYDDGMRTAAKTFKVIVGGR